MQDVQRLQHKLQKTQNDARSIISQNKWLEKQTSKADQILAKAVEVERRKANDEMGRVRDSMKGVLERERMLMRGRIAGGGSSSERSRVLATHELEATEDNISGTCLHPFGNDFLPGLGFSPTVLDSHLHVCSGDDI